MIRRERWSRDERISMVRVTEAGGTDILINPNCVAAMVPDAHKVVISGNSGLGNGLLHLEQSSFDALSQFFEEVYA